MKGSRDWETGKAEEAGRRSAGSQRCPASLFVVAFLGLSRLKRSSLGVQTRWLAAWNSSSLICDERADAFGICRGDCAMHCAGLLDPPRRAPKRMVAFIEVFHVPPQRRRWQLMHPASPSREDVGKCVSSSRPFNHPQTRLSKEKQPDELNSSRSPSLFFPTKVQKFKAV